MSALLVLITVAAVVRAHECGQILIPAYVVDHSIEESNPGVSRRIDDLRHAALVARVHSRTDRRRLAGGIVEDLNALVAKYPYDPRLYKIVREVVTRTERYAGLWANPKHRRVTGDVTRLRSLLLDLWVACQVPAREVYLNRRVSQIVPLDVRPLRSSFGPTEWFRFDRELDVAAQRSDGSWLWLEVKNWGDAAFVDQWRIDKLIQQSRGQDELRARLANAQAPIELWLVTAEANSAAVTEDLRRSLNYDRVTHARALAGR